MYLRSLKESHLSNQVGFLLPTPKDYSVAEVVLGGFLGIYLTNQHRTLSYRPTEERAFECAQFAAAHSVAEGELILGNLLFWGRGCEADMNKAYELYSRAYEHGMYYASVMMKKIDQIKQNVTLETE